jgi:hypothetical protein
MAVGLFLVLAACSSGGSGGATGQTCPGGFDAGGMLGGTYAVSQSGQCGNLSTGSGQNGAACQTSSDCAPTCCACPGNSRSAQVSWCHDGACVVSTDVCCVWIDENEGLDGGGVPLVCSK